MTYGLGNAFFELNHGFRRRALHHAGVFKWDTGEEETRLLMAIATPEAEWTSAAAEFTPSGTSEMETRFTMEEQHRNVTGCWPQKNITFRLEINNSS